MVVINIDKGKETTPNPVYRCEQCGAIIPRHISPAQAKRRKHLFCTKAHGYLWRMNSGREEWVRDIKEGQARKR